MYRGTRMSMEVIVTIVSTLVYNQFKGRNHPAYIVIIHLLSTMDVAGFHVENESTSETRATSLWTCQKKR